jgi:hypothetical protein
MIKDIKNIDNKGENMSLTGIENISSKISRLITAVYMVAHCVKEDEEIKRLLIDESMSLLATVKNLEFFRSDLEENSRAVKRSLSYIKSLLDIALAMKYISTMNHLVVTNRIALILNLSRSVFDEVNNRGDMKINLESFFVEEYKGIDVKDTKGHIKDTMSFKKSYTQNTLENIKDINGDKEERINKILGFLKNNQKSNIKDISTNIGQASEKTIQRDLIFLVAKGKVVRQGERRWSTYSLLNG